MSVIPIELAPAETVLLATRAEVLNAAFGDHPVRLEVTPSQLERMDFIYDVALKRSVIARVAGVPCGMGLLSVRGRQGWISAVGVIPEKRGLGIARDMMAYLCQQARMARLERLTLEVVAGNLRAKSLYDALGFTVRRRLFSWRLAADPTVSGTRAALDVLEPEVALQHFDRWHDEPPPWQHAAATLRKMQDSLQAFVAEQQGRPAGYSLLAEREGQLVIYDIGTNPRFKRAEVGVALLRALRTAFPQAVLTYVNLPESDALTEALRRLDATLILAHDEMVLDL